MLSSVVLILSRILRSLYLLYLIKGISPQSLESYEQYTLSLIFLVIIPQVTSQRLLNLSITNNEKLRVLFYKVLIVSFLSFPIILFTSGIESLYLCLVSFYILEIPIYSNKNLSPKFKLYISILYIIVIFVAFYNDFDIEGFLVIDTIFKAIAFSTFIFISTKFEFGKLKLKSLFNEEEYTLSYIVNGVIGLSKYRFFDLILINFNFNNDLLLVNRMVEMIYGYVSIISSSIYSNNFNNGKIKTFKISNHDRLLSLTALIISSLSIICASLYFKNEYYINLIVLGGLISSILIYWWGELAYYSRLRVYHKLFQESIKCHVLDVFNYAYLMCVINTIIIGIDWWFLVTSICLSVFFVYKSRVFQRQRLNEYIINK